MVLEAQGGSEAGPAGPSAGGESGAVADESVGVEAASGVGAVPGSGAETGGASAGLLGCSGPGVFFALGVAVAVFPFLFLMRIFPMSSAGHGIGWPGFSCTQANTYTQGKAHMYTCKNANIHLFID